MSDPFRPPGNTDSLATMPSDIEEPLEVKEWDEDNQPELWTRGPWKLLRSVLTLSFLRSLFFSCGSSSGNGASQGEKRLRPTAYLDGLRGFAAFLVYWHHHELWARKGLWLEFLENGYGYKEKYFFINFPFVRVFLCGGHFAVSVFFVISGYVLSTKPMSLIHAGEQAKLADNLSSALFRRWLRLYIPIICTTFLYMTSWHVFGFYIEGVNRKGSYGEELVSWYNDLKNFTFIYNLGGSPFFRYNFHLWSIPVEFRGSIVVYTSLLAFSRCSRNARLWLQAGLLFYFIYICDGTYTALFVSGMLLCDLDLLASQDDLPAFFGKFGRYSKLIFYSLFVFSLYLGGVPAATTDIQNLRKIGGWYFLSFLKPQAVFDYKWFYLFWAATMLVVSVSHISWLRRFFETRFCQFLGRISYALYLVHGPIIWMLGDRLYAAAGFSYPDRQKNIPGWIDLFPLPKTSPSGLEVAFLVPHIILLPLTLYTAEIVTRAFDEPSVRIPQWLYKKTQGRPSAAAAGPSTRLLS